MPKTLIAGNWKMNGLKEAVGEAETLKSELSDGSSDVEVLICPPATLVDRIASLFADTALEAGGQDCHTEVSGAHTGDISAQMIADLGGSYVIVGHSERRADHGESNETVKAKAVAALNAGLVPIICVGETLEQRDAGNTLAVLDDQITHSLPEGVNGSAFVIAYEPVWAIGTGRVPEISDIGTAHDFIRQKLSALGVVESDEVRLLYGGSVKPGNAAEILAVENVNGALVGGASLKASDFLGIIRA